MVAVTHARSVRVPKTAELVAGKFRREIMLGLLKEGDPLPPEAQLVEEFGVARATLREAFRILESEGLISVRRGARGGARVHTPSGDVAARYAAFVLQFRGATVQEIVDARAALEIPCAAIVARRRSSDDVRRLREANDAAQAVMNDAVAYLERHRDFHKLIVDLAGNRAVALLASITDTIIDRALRGYIEPQVGSRRQQQVARRAHRCHVELVELIEAKDVEAAEAVWRAHVDGAARQMVSMFGSSAALEIMD